MKHAALERTLRATSLDGTRSALLLIGNGVHIQAARQVGLPEPDPWAAAVRRISHVVGVLDVDRLPRSLPLLWDALARRALAAGKAPALETEIRDYLAVIERERRLLPLFGQILDLGFENVVSLNIDRTLALHAGNETFVREKPLAGHPAFYRHSRVSNGRGVVTRIWYPHGDTAAGGRLRLGTSGFEAELMALEDERAPMMKDWVEMHVASWSHAGAKPHTVLKSPARFYEESRRDPDGWYRLAFTAPLVVIGASLPLADWPIWWLLHQRSRNHTPFPPHEVPPTFFLSARGEMPPYLAGRPSVVETVEFPTHDSLWRFVLRE